MHKGTKEVKTDSGEVITWGTNIDDMRSISKEINLRELALIYINILKKNIK